MESYRPVLPVGEYERVVAENFTAALQEGGMFFENMSKVHQSLRKLAQRLQQRGIPYALAGGMAVAAHGHPRFTSDIDLLVTPAGLKAVHEALVGLGYLPVVEGSKNLRDTETGVKIEFLVEGQYPGDGLPKPVAFPDPAAFSVDMDGIRVLTLPKLIELKLASGLSSPGRIQDLADVQHLIRRWDLPNSVAEQLNPYVRDKYRELWSGVSHEREGTS